MRNGENGSEVDLLSWCVLLNIVLVVCKLRTLAQTDVALWRAIAGDVFERSGSVGVDGCDSGLSTDLGHGWARQTGWRACNVAMSENGGGEQAYADDR